MPLMKAKDISNNPMATLLIYGRNRSGKTRLIISAAECPELQPMLLIDADANSDYVARAYPEIDVFRFDNKREWNSQTKELMKVVESGKYKCIALDTITYWLDVLLTEMTVGRKATYDVWNKIFFLAKKLVWHLRKHSEFVIVTALREEVMDNEGNVREYRPYILGKKFPNIYMSLCRIVGFLEFVELPKRGGVKTIRRFSTVPSGKYIAGDTADEIGVIEEPTMRKILDKMNKKEENA